MLSKTERDYLTGRLETSKTYRRVLEHRIRNKLKDFYMLELPLIEKSGITEFRNVVTKNSNAEAILYQKLKGEEGIRTPIDSLCRRTHSRSATSPQSKRFPMNN